jgi:hypothetical protein
MMMTRSRGRALAQSRINLKTVLPILLDNFGPHSFSELRACSKEVLAVFANRSGESDMNGEHRTFNLYEISRAGLALLPAVERWGHAGRITVNAQSFVREVLDYSSKTMEGFVSKVRELTLHVDISATYPVFSQEELELKWESDGLMNISYLRVIFEDISEDCSDSDGATLSRRQFLKSLTGGDTMLPYGVFIGFTEGLRLEVADLAFLNNMCNLGALHMSGCRVTDLWNLEPLSGLTELTELDLSSQENLLSLEGISSLHNLKDLNVSFNEDIDDLAPLSELCGITSLCIGYTDVSDLAPIEKLVHLEYLFIDRTNITDILVLSKFLELRELNMSCLEIASLDPIARLVHLEHLDVACSFELKDIKPLRELRKLRYLRIDDSKVADLSPLRNCVELETLSANSSPIVDLSPLSNMSKLDTLEIMNTGVCSLLPLRGLCKLKKLDIRNTPVTPLPDWLDGIDEVVVY